MAKMSRSLNRQSIARAVAQETGLSEIDAKQHVDQLFELICDALAAGEDVKLANFGSFQILQAPERFGRNPKNGEPAPIAARQRIPFKASKHLLAQVKEQV